MVGVFGTDGRKLKEVMVERAELLRSVALDMFCARFLVGTTSGAMAVYSLPNLTCVKRGAGANSQPAEAVVLLGEHTAVSVSSDCSIHFLDCRGSNLCLSPIVILVYFVVVLILTLLVYCFFPLSMLPLSPASSGPPSAEALEVARRVAASVEAELRDSGEL